MAETAFLFLAVSSVSNLFPDCVGNKKSGKIVVKLKIYISMFPVYLSIFFFLGGGQMVAWKHGNKAGTGNNRRSTNAVTRDKGNAATMQDMARVFIHSTRKLLQTIEKALNRPKAQRLGQRQGRGTLRAEK
jgi:hypothetical protein